MLQELQAKQNEDVKQSIRHDEIIKEDLSKLSETVEEIASTLNDMKEKDNITEVKKLKEKLVGCNGLIYTGCNIENASYGASNCAERTAIFKGISEGCTSFAGIAIVGGRKDEE